MDRSCAFETKWLKGSATLTKVRLTALLKGFLIPGQIKSNELYPARAQFFVLQLLANGNNLTPEMFNLLIAVFLVVSLFSSINAAGAIEPYTSIRYNEPYVIRLNRSLSPPPLSMARQFPTFAQYFTTEAAISFLIDNGAELRLSPPRPCN